MPSALATSAIGRPASTRSSTLRRNSGRYPRCPTPLSSSLSGTESNNTTPPNRGKTTTLSCGFQTASVLIPGSPFARFRVLLKLRGVEAIHAGDSPRWAERSLVGRVARKSAVDLRSWVGSSLALIHWCRIEFVCLKRQQVPVDLREWRWEHDHSTRVGGHLSGGIVQPR